MTRAKLFRSIPWVIALAAFIAMLLRGKLVIDSASIGLIGALGGATVTHLFALARESRQNNRDDRLRFLDQRRASYVRFSGLCNEILLGPAELSESDIAKAIGAGNSTFAEIELIASARIVESASHTWGLVSDLLIAVPTDRDREHSDASRQLRATIELMRSELGSCT